MTRKQRRLSLIGAALGVLALAVALVLGALKDSIVFFNSPTEVAENHVKPGTRIRIGGLVKEGSVQRGESLAVRFEVTDGRSTVPVAYQGLLPDSVPRRAGGRRRRRPRSDGHLPRRQRARQARRDLHAEGGRRQLEEAGPLEGRIRKEGGRRAPGQGAMRRGPCKLALGVVPLARATGRPRS